MRHATLMLLFFSATQACAEGPDAQKVQFFETKVRPLLLEKCGGCHGAEEQESGLRLDRAESFFQGGDTGPIVKPGKPDESRMIQLVRGEDSDLVMPPDERLGKEQIAVLERWVREGTAWPGYDSTKPLPARKSGPLFTEEQRAFWAFQPLSRPAVPALNSEWVVSPIDAFVLANLQEQGLQPSPAADKRTLLRRATFDLTGLPPAPNEIDAFLADNSAGAWQRVVDRLLTSPAYGEKWGRHWLDIVRFAESAAHDGNNGYLYAWRYRDYVIDALNRDQPYNEFIVEQLAGDLLPGSGDAAIDLRRLIATGFLQVGPKPVVMRDKRQMLLDIADEQLSVTGLAFLGLTIGCARCHDHKFDPIPTQDYYSLAGIFMSTHVMHDMAADSMWIEPEVPGPDGTMIRVMAVRDQPQPSDMRVHLRGAYQTLGDEAPRRFLQIIAGENQAPIETAGSGRLELARWIAAADNPLTARTMVNRVWQQHFGRGIVASTDDFGARGERPTHPQLLDWLAQEFIRHDWSFKALHRTMLLTNTYRQSASTDNLKAAAIDPDNRLLWRMPRRRLSAEEIRDAILFASQTLNRAMGGTLFISGYNFNRPDVKLSVVDIGDPDHYGPFKEPRRSVYLPVIRNQMHPMLALFDTANEHIPVTKRNESIVAPQALFLMNSDFARQSASNIAIATRRLEDDLRIQEIYLRLLGRPPSATELANGRIYIRNYRMATGVSPAELRTSTKPPALKPYDEEIRNTPGLLAYYRLNEIRTIAGQAVTPNSLNPAASPGAIVGGATFRIDGAVPYKTDVAGRDPAIELNGKNQRIQIDDVTFLSKASDALTVEYWIKPAEMSQQYAVGLDHLATGKRYWKSGIHPAEVDGKKQLFIYHEFFGAGGGFRVPTTSRGAVEIGRWSHVAFNLGLGRRQLFVNGELVEEFKVEAKPSFGAAPLTLGSRADDMEWLQGGIDEVAVYDRVLDKQTVKNHFLAGSGRPAETLDPDLPVWQSFCQALFCMNEFIFVE